MKKIYKFLIVITLFAASLNLNAQYGSYGITDAQTAALGNSFGSSYSILAIGKNPGFLGYSLDSNNYIAFQIPNFQMKAIQSTMSIDDFNNYFNYPEARNLSDAERDDFFSTFDDNNGLYFNAGSKVFALAVKPNDMLGTFAFSMTDYFAGTANVPLTLIDLMVNGNAQNKTYSFDDLAFNMWWIRAHTLSWGNKIMDFDEGFIKSTSAGVSAKLISGYAYAGIEKFDANFTTGENNVLSGNVDYLAQTALSTNFGTKYEHEGKDIKYENNPGYMNEPAGSGFGFDIGFAADLEHNLKIGLALTDIGSINWDTHAAEYKASGDIYVEDLFDEDQRNDLENFLEDSSYAVGSFSTSLPTALRVSAQYHISEEVEAIPGELKLLVGYHQGFNNMPGNSTVPRIAVGAMWEPLSFLPAISTGFTNNRAGEMAWSFGLGYSTSVLDFCIATQDMMSLMSGAGSPHISFAMNFLWRITL